MKERQKDRIGEIDFLKFVFIVLMIAFHLVYIGDTYPLAKQFVYTFHMPAFLVISGFMINTRKPTLQMLRTMLWFLIPYAVMEAGYTCMASVLPIREHVDALTLPLLIEKIFVHPLGPYWYLHTLILCSLTYYLVFSFLKINRLTLFILLGLIFYVYEHYLHIVSLPCALYFMAGAVVRQSGLAFLDVFRASWLAIVPAVWMAFYPDNLHSSTVAGVMITYLMMSFFLSVHGILPVRIAQSAHFIGRNTLPLLLFSPIFTALAKLYQPHLLRVESTGMLFLVASLVITVGGCLFITFVMDRLHMSRYFFGRRKAMQ